MILQFDEKTTIWKRYKVRVPDGTSLEDAMKAFEEDDCDILDSEYLDDTATPMLVLENEGEATLEMYDEQGDEFLLDNGTNED